MAWRTRPWAQAAAAAALVAASSYVSSWCTHDVSSGAAGGRPVLGPLNAGFATLSYDRDADLPLPRLVVTAERSAATDDDVIGALAFVSKVLRRRRPFSVLYDMRAITLPTLSRKQLGLGVDWAREQAAPLDAQLQCIAYLIRSPLVRAAAQVVIRFLKPPQPTFIGACGTDAALEARPTPQNTSP